MPFGQIEPASSNKYLKPRKKSDNMACVVEFNCVEISH